jgi:hypothetical protein
MVACTGGAFFWCREGCHPPVFLRGRRQAARGTAHLRAANHTPATRGSARAFFEHIIGQIPALRFSAKESVQSSNQANETENFVQIVPVPLRIWVSTTPASVDNMEAETVCMSASVFTGIILMSWYNPPVQC